MAHWQSGRGFACHKMVCVILDLPLRVKQIFVDVPLHVKFFYNNYVLLTLLCAYSQDVLGRSVFVTSYTIG